MVPIPSTDNLLLRIQAFKDVIDPEVYFSVFELEDLQTVDEKPRSCKAEK